MTIASWCTALWKYLRHRADIERDLDDELRGAEDLLVADALARGVDGPEARRAAAVDLGGRTQLKEQVRDGWAGARLDALAADLRSAAHGLSKSPGFVTLSAGTLALGIGANAAVLTLASAILVRPLPYRDADRLATVNLLFPDGSDLGISGNDVPEWLARLRTVEAVAAYHTRDLTIRGVGEPRVARTAYVTGGFFDVLGFSPPQGASSPIDARDAVVISETFTHVLADTPATAIFGRHLRVGPRTLTVSAMMPASFGFPSDDVQLWARAPTPDGTPLSEAGFYRLVARLQPGVTEAQLSDDAYRVLRELRGVKTPNRVSVVSLDAAIRADVRPILRVAVVAALLVLVVACANVATLFVGRSVARRRDLATQIALGAGTGRLIRRVGLEAAGVAIAGALIGVGLASVTVRVFVNAAAGVLPRLREVALDGLTVTLIILVTGAAAIGCSLVPAWHVARTEAHPRTTLTSAPVAWRVRTILMVGQIALSVMLLCGAGLLLRTAVVLVRADAGFDRSRALAVTLVLADTVLFDGTTRTGFVQDLLDRVRALPGVRFAGLGSTLPARRPPITIGIRYIDERRDEFRLFALGSSTPGYMRALGIRLIKGRDFQDGDDQTTTGTVVLSESAARHLFGTRDPLGQRVNRLPTLAGPAQPVVVGVVSDVKYNSLDVPAGGAIYVPWMRRPTGTAYLIVRTDGAARALASAVREIARTLDPSMPSPEILTLEEVLARSVGTRRLRVAPAVGLGLLALMITLVGLLGTLSRLALERRRESAIRAALGASPRQIGRRLLVTGGVVTACGLILGIGLGLVISRGLTHLLYGVAPHDLTTFVTVTAVVGLSALAACAIPAWRAAQFDPARDLRYE